jgi:mitochondrial chaperone BCS1
MAAQLLSALLPTATSELPLTMANGTANPSSGAPPASSNGAPLSPQFVMLDMLIPGFSTFSSVLHTYAGIDLNMYIPVIMLISWAIWSSNYLSSSCWGLVEHYLMCSVRIRTDDEIYDMIMAWVASQSFSRDSRNFMANTDINSRSWSRMYWYGDEDDDGDDGYGFSRRDKKKTELTYTPSYGSHKFWFRRRLLFFNRDINRETSTSFLASKQEEVTISCLWFNPNVLKDLLREVREQYISKDENKTIIYRGASNNQEGTSWTRCMARASRPFSTVILNDKVKTDLIADVTDYLDPVTRKWYSNRGIPYRRGYLLYGPPGTGKSSLSLALAGFFGLRIYILSLSSPSATEENVQTLFSTLPRKCVVLLEDIDSAGLTHTREADASSDASGSEDESEPEEPAPEPPQHSSRPGRGRRSNRPEPTQGSGKLSLSGLLNILDGVASQEGRVLIMTTNHLEKLDKALIRPGRVDMVVKFGRADTDMAASIFRAIYAPYEDEEVPAAISRDVKVLADADEDVTAEKKAALGRAAILDKVRNLAGQFAAKIPEDEFSPAELQGLLLKHKRDPVAAIESIESWIGETRKERADKVVRDAEEEKKHKEKEEKKERERKKKREEKKKQQKKDEAEDEEKEADEEKKDEAKTEDIPKEKQKGSGHKKEKSTSDSGYETP